MSATTRPVVRMTPPGWARRQEIEALLATIEAAAPAILNGLDQGLERTRETLDILDTVATHR